MLGNPHRAFYFPNVPRVAIVEASSVVKKEGRSYLAFLFDFDFAGRIHTLSNFSTSTDIREEEVLGSWCNLELDNLLDIKVVTDDYGYFRIYSVDNVYEISPFYEWHLSSVFEQPDEPYVVFGRPSFQQFVKLELVPKLEQRSDVFKEICTRVQGPPEVLFKQSIGTYLD